MAKRPIPAKMKSTTTTATDSPKEAPVTTIKKSTCKTLQGTATLTYHIGLDDTGAIHWKIAGSTGNGMYSREYVAFTDIQKALADWPADLPITSMTLRPLFKGKSVSTPAFLLATLVKEGILAPVPDKKRHYQLRDAKPFLTEVVKLQCLFTLGRRGNSETFLRIDPDGTRHLTHVRWIDEHIAHDGHDCLNPVHAAMDECIERVVAIFLSP